VGPTLDTIQRWLLWSTVMHVIEGIFGRGPML
jgi:hypothetical protein